MLTARVAQGGGGALARSGRIVLRRAENNENNMESLFLKELKKRSISVEVRKHTLSILFFSPPTELLLHTSLFLGYLNLSLATGNGEW